MYEAEDPYWMEHKTPVVWKPVVGYEGVYKVSSTGLVAKIHSSSGLPDRILPVIMRKGEPMVVLILNYRYVALLVAEAFYGYTGRLSGLGFRDGDNTNCNRNNIYAVVETRKKNREEFQANVDFQERENASILMGEYYGHQSKPSPVVEKHEKHGLKKLLDRIKNYFS